jgi:hypothetical protein
MAFSLGNAHASVVASMPLMHDRAQQTRPLSFDRWAGPDLEFVLIAPGDERRPVGGIAPLLLVTRQLPV